MTSVEQVFVGIAILVLGGLTLAGMKWLFVVSVNAVAKAIVKSINGQLGLTQIRDDVIELKEDVSDLAVKFGNIEGQFEKILTDL